MVKENEKTNLKKECKTTGFWRTPKNVNIMDKDYREYKT